VKIRLGQEDQRRHNVVHGHILSPHSLRTSIKSNKIFSLFCLLSAGLSIDLLSSVLIRNYTQYPYVQIYKTAI
jgi:hypothetical protein